MSAVQMAKAVTHWPLSRLKPYARNPRTHSAEQIAKIAASIREFGFVNPILVDEQAGIIAGHGRLEAAKQLGLEKVPVIELTHLSEAQKRAYIIADNRLALDAGWDEDLLAEELKALDSLDYDLALTGFDEDELHGLLEDEFAEEPPAPEPPADPVTRAGDLWVLGGHRLLCGDSRDPAAVDRLLGGAPIHLVNTDPPYNVRVEPRSNNAINAGLSSFSGPKHHQSLDLARYPKKAKPTGKMRAKDRPLANDFVSDDAFAAMLTAWFGNLARVLLPGGAFYIWGGYANCANYPPVLKAAGLYFSQAIIWVKEHPVLTRKDYMGNHEWCQPGETAVLTPDGRVPISTLRDGDQVVSFRRCNSELTGRRGSVPVRRAERPYAGPLLRVVAGEKETWCTPGHIWSVKLAPAAAEKWCVYLMRRGPWWRIGKSKLLSTWGFGVKHRLKTEDGDAAWILSVHDTNLDATIHEQAAQARYGIPTTTWSETYGSRRTLVDVSRVYEALDLGALERGALQAIADHGRDPAYPFIERLRCRPKIGRRVSLRARACNLIAGVMLIPVPDREGAGPVRWSPIRSVAAEPYEGMVHSLDVPRLEHYVADGLVTHNCFYGWREGAAHKFYGPANVPDVWSVKKVNPQAMVHLTQKPVELAVRAIHYSSRPGENVLDLFGGSGSTLLGAEETGRRSFLMELDPPYCDVIVERWQEATGKEAVLEADGRTFARVAKARGVKSA